MSVAKKKETKVSKVAKKTKPLSQSSTVSKPAKPLLKSGKKVEPVQAKKKVQAAPTKPKAVAPATKPALPPRAPSYSFQADQVLPARLQTLLDKADIRETIYHAVRAIDRLDETLLRSVFHADATLDLGPGIFQGASSDYVPWVLAVMAQARSTHHLIGQVDIHLDGEVARVETYAQVHLRSDKPTGREDLFMGLRYLDRMERRPAGRGGVYKISHRKQVVDWVRTEVVSDLFYHQNPDALWGAHTKADPSYHMANFPGSNGRSSNFLGRHYDPKSFKF